MRVCHGAAPALWGVSLAMRAAELSCVIGPNGAGKTTLFNCITGMFPPSEGIVTFDGSQITGRLLDFGHTVYGTNRTRSRADALIDRGLLWRDSPREGNMDPA